MKTGVVIGRFQTHELHSGQTHLIDCVQKENDVLVILIGEATVPFTDKNPLSYEIRKQHLETLYPFARIKCIYDMYDDLKWSMAVDDLLAEYENVTLYGSRDSFIPQYKGIYKTKEIDEVYGYNATQLRYAIKRTTINDSSFRAGIIHTTQNVYPTAFPTVDIAVVKYQKDDRSKLLLGRKASEPLFRFIGGFVDPSDKSLEAAAYRELHEEVLGLDTHEFRYICSKKINDPRYVGTKHGIVTTFFLTHYFSGRTIPSDDIAELRWFDLFTCGESIMPLHQPLYQALLKHLQK